MNAEFPGNSKMPRPPVSAPAPSEKEKKIDPVVTNVVEVRKKSLGRRLANIFVGGDSKSVLNYVFMDVLVPQAKDMITEAVSQGFERMIYGDARPSSRQRYSGSRSGGHPVAYNRYAVRGNNPLGRAGIEDRRLASPNGRTQDVNDLLFATRVEAETTLDRMYDLLKEYEIVSVADLYSLVGISGTYVDAKWGWDALQGSRVRNVRDGYTLELPRTIALD